MKQWAVAVFVVGVGVAIAIGYGGGVGSGNQVTYLLEPLHLADGELFVRDWLVSTTTAYHEGFNQLAARLFRADECGAVAFGIAHVLAMVALIAAIYRLIAAVVATQRVTIFAVLAGLLALGGGRALGGTYLVATYFQPSSIGTVAWLGAMVLWVRGRHAGAGIALAAGGAFHINFLVLGIALFGASELSAWRTRCWIRVTMLLAPSVVVLAMLLPGVRAASDAGEPELALRVLVEFHAPGHYDVLQVIAALPPLVGWCVLAWATKSASPRLERLWRFAAIGTAMCALAFVAIAVVPSMTRLFVWRVAPFAQLAAQIIVLVAVITRSHPLLGRRAPAVVIGLAIVVAWSVAVPGGGPLYSLALACVILAVAIGRQLPRAGLPAVIMAIALVPVARTVVAPDLFTEALGGRYRDLLLWARTTERDAVFLVPPYVHAFRFLARRAIVADSRSPPLYPDELVAWYRRLCAMVGVDDAATHEEIERRYDRLTGAELVAAARRFNARYVVVDKRRSQTRFDAPVAFEDWRIVAFRID